MGTLGWLALRRKVMAQSNGTNSRYSAELRRQLVREARMFRALGWSWRRIGRALGGVSHATLRSWCELYGELRADAESVEFVQVTIVDGGSEQSC